MSERINWEAAVIKKKKGANGDEEREKEKDGSVLAGM